MIELFPDKTVLFQWVIFMVALVTLTWGIFRPVLRIIEGRRTKTDGARKEASELDRKSKEMTGLCERRVEEARIAGVREKDQIKASAEKFVEGLLKETRLEIDRRIDEVRRQIEQEAREDSLQLKQYAQEIGREVASKVLEREI